MRIFFLKSTRPSFIDKAGCTQQFESELSLRSFAQLFPLREEPPPFSVFFNGLYAPFGSPCWGQKRCSNRFARRLTDHQWSRQRGCAGWNRLA